MHAEDSLSAGIPLTAGLYFDEFSLYLFEKAVK